MTDPIDLKPIRKAARRYADGEADVVIELWPEPVGSRRALEHVIAEHVGLPPEHRRRAYYKLALLAAMNAYDGRMAQRRRRLFDGRANKASNA